MGTLVKTTSIMWVNTAESLHDIYITHDANNREYLKTHPRGIRPGDTSSPSGYLAHKEPPPGCCGVKADTVQSVGNSAAVYREGSTRR